MTNTRTRPETMRDTMAVELSGVTKRYGELTALDDVSLVVRPGTVHGLIGENGAGKSTLSKIMFGMVAPDRGSVRVLGTDTTSTSAARAAGVGMVHQHFAQAPSMSVLENLALAARASDERRILSLREVGRRAQDVAGRLGFDLDLRARVEKLSVGARQRIEIVKALQHGARVLLLDEPTAVLAPAEIAELVELMRGLAETGTAVVFVSHKLEEVRAACDEVTVLRRGRVAARLDGAGLSARALARAMTGDDPVRAPKAAIDPGPAALVVRELHARDDRGRPAVTGAGLSIHEGEIVGIAGIDGNGQEEFVEAIAGLRGVESGGIELHGTSLAGRKPREIRGLGVAHIASDRLETGVAPTLSIQDNVVAARYRDPEHARFGFTRPRAGREAVEQAIADYDIRGASPALPIGALSGGNMQKVVVARELANSPAVLLAAHPTRGVDLKAIERIHAAILGARVRGCAVMLLSTELDELLALSDRIVVFSRGRIVAELDPAKTDPAEIGVYMTGATPTAVTPAIPPTPPAAPDAGHLTERTAVAS
ncbi:ABC transporter ATP-binding protein [Agromyces badenianii]|uniref:ABC transporter ATP-binding protein n=1 Tax=Agromyces badenianii TaxID=2080742 RepID=UPI00105A54ED|nr:ABC transporter ATP-binding protein [Agromyces badenianii]